MTKDLDATPTLQGAGTRLRAVSGSDVVVRASLGRRREIVRALGGDLARDTEMTEAEASAQLSRRFGPGPHWVMADEHDRFIGTLRLAPVDLAHRSARLGIAIFDPAHHGQGHGTEAIRLAISYGFDQLDLHRIELTVLADNHPAIAAYSKCGFEVEGRLRRTLWRDGRWYDDLAMAILAP